MTLRTFAVLACALVLAAGTAGAQARGGAAQSGKAATPKDSAAAKQQSAPGQSDMKLSMALDREVFSYNGAGKRDPMISLMNTSDIRPLITEVQVIGIAFDEDGSNHMAVLKNIADKKNTLYRVKVGQMLGRMRVTAITRTEVIFTVDEIGVSRQEKLSMKPDTTAKRTP